MSHWQQLGIEEKLIEILHDIPDTASEHHFGRPFLTAYKIAIEFARLFPQDVAQIGVPIGGAGIGQRSSLAQYLARNCSRGIKAGTLPRVEGGFSPTSTCMTSVLILAIRLSAHRSLTLSLLCPCSACVIDKNKHKATEKSRVNQGDTHGIGR